MEGAATLNTGLGRAKDGTHRLAVGLGGANGATGRLAAGAEGLAGGLDEAERGSRALGRGLTRLGGEIVRLSDGATEVETGVGMEAAHWAGVAGVLLLTVVWQACGVLTVFTALGLALSVYAVHRGCTWSMRRLHPESAL